MAYLDLATVLILLFVVLSFVLVIGVPVAFAIPGEWDKSRGFFLGGFSLWVALIILIGFLTFKP